jgi:acetolactate synthase-1/2/3 large subunit
MQVFEAMVKGLAGIGVDAAFGGAGESDTGLMLALEHEAGIRPVITRNEQAAAFMACGYAMFTDRLGVCFATAGPGAFNLISGMSMALTDSYPFLAITGYSSLEFEGKGQLNETSGIGRTPDSQAMIAATTKYSDLLTDPADTSAMLEKAVNIAFAGRPGPVHIAVTEDIAQPRVSVENYRAIRLNVEPVEDPTSVRDVASVLIAALRETKRVVVLAGFGAIRSGAGNDLQMFLERYRIPLITTMDGKGIIPEEHELAIGVFGDTGHTSAWDIFLDAEVVLAIGNSFAQHATFDFRSDLFDGKKLIHVNIDPGEIDKVYKTDHAIVSDAKTAIAGLTEEMAKTDVSVPSRRYGTQDYDTEKIFRLRHQLHPGQLAQSLSRRLPDNAVVLGDAGAHVAWLGYYLELSAGQNFRKPGTYGPMAGHTNGALGVKYAEPDRPVIVGCGDGCYNMSGFELMTAVEYDIPVIWIIFNDGEFKLIKLYQLASYLEHGLVEFENLDYVAYAKACGAVGYRVETLKQFERALDAALASGKPTLIDARITRLALPHYSSSPEGRLAGILEMIRKRFGWGSPVGMLAGVFDGVRRRFADPVLPGLFARTWRTIRGWFGGG